MAPEVLEGHYDYKCDIWSLGVLLYVFMSGYLPFQGQNRNEVFNKISTGNFHFKHAEFQTCSQDVIDLIKQLLIVDPNKRITAFNALQHNWFKYVAELDDKPQNQIDHAVIDRLKSFKGASKLKRAAMNMLVKMADQEEIEKLGAQFQQLDKDKTGMLNAWELRAAIVESDLQLTNEQIDQVITEVDYFGNNKINYSEFLMATLDVQQFLCQNKLQAIFNQFDTDNSGYITQENIVTAMNKIGHNITQKDLDDIMSEHDI